MDLGPLRRHREFRLLFAGQGLSLLGSMVTFVGIPFQAYELTGSTLVVGLLSLAELPPLLVVPFLGGALADAFDRRRLVWLTELGFLACSSLLVVNALLPDPYLWPLFVLGALISALDGLQRPPLDALTPRLVERHELTAASALDSFRMNIGTVAGPALGGLLIAAAGLPATYLFDVLTFAVSLALLARMRAVPPPPEAEPPSLRGIVAGIRYARSREELLGTYGVDIVAMFFGMPMALFPAFAQEFGGPGVLGILYAAPSAGALVATLTSGWTGRVHRHGLAVILAASCWGVGIVGFGLAPSLPLALVCLGFAGAADMVSGIFRGTIWNQTIPDGLRGRLAGIEQVSWSSGPTLGNLRAGALGSLVGLRATVVSGGILCVVGVALFALALPAFRRYDAREHPGPRVPSAEAAAG
ncbi:MAG: MFS transporter [Thermoleophilia bacterium]|nr:MFS transporter [Thermoleophilia bacterium]